MSDEAPQTTPGERAAAPGPATPVGPVDSVTSRVSLDKETAPSTADRIPKPAQPRAGRTPAPVDPRAGQAPAPVTPRADRTPVQDAWAPASVHGQRTLTSPPSAPADPAGTAPAPWAAPAGGTATPAPAPHPAQLTSQAPAPQPNPFAPPTPAPPPSNPFAPPNPSPAPNPFAPPASHATPNPYAPPAPAPPAHAFLPPAGPAPVPPPPIAPDGPGQVPYGYPGTLPAYGHPGPPHAPYADAPYPVGSGYGWGTQPAPSNGMGTASLVLGIISAVGFLAWPLALVLGVLAIIFGALGRGKAKRGEATNPGVALAGLICGATGIVLVLGLFAVIIAAYG